MKRFAGLLTMVALMASSLTLAQPATPEGLAQEEVQAREEHIHRVLQQAPDLVRYKLRQSNVHLLAQRLGAARHLARCPATGGLTPEINAAMLNRIEVNLAVNANNPMLAAEALTEQEKVRRQLSAARDQELACKTAAAIASEWTQLTVAEE